MRGSDPLPAAGWKGGESGSIGATALEGRAGTFCPALRARARSDPAPERLVDEPPVTETLLAFTRQVFEANPNLITDKIFELLEKFCEMKQETQDASVEISEEAYKGFYMDTTNECKIKV